MTANITVPSDMAKPKLTCLNPEMPASYYERRRSSVFSTATATSNMSSCSSRSSELEPEKAAFCSSLQKFFNNDTFSDASVHCQGREFKVHSLVLSMHSEFFARAFSGPWKESANGRHIDLEEVDVAAVEAMLRFMYHFEYTVPGDWFPLQFDAIMYSLADRYIIPQLKDYSKTKFESALKESWENIEEELPEDLPSVVAEVFETTPASDRGLRDPIVEVCHKHMSALSRHEAFLTTLNEVPALASDLAAYLEAPPAQNWCSSCYEPRQFQEAYCRVCHTSFGLEEASQSAWPGVRSGSISC